MCIREFTVETITDAIVEYINRQDDAEEQVRAIQVLREFLGEVEVSIQKAVTYGNDQPRLWD